MTFPNVVFHVGYHKTGTTWMQRRLFQPAHGYLPLMSHEDVFAEITRPHKLAFDPAAPREMIAARMDETQTNVPVVSSEILSGHPFWGGRDSADFAERIAAITPDAKILLTIRAQIPAIASVYMQYVRRGGRLPAKRFFGGAKVLGFDGFDPVHFEYHRLVARYQELFGSENVKVLTQEQLARDPEGFVADLRGFTGAAETPLPSTEREGASETEIAVPLLRRFNMIKRDGAAPDPILDLTPLSAALYRGTGWIFRRPAIKKSLGKKRPVTALAKTLFEGRYQASNKALLEMMPGLDLPGYEI